MGRPSLAEPRRRQIIEGLRTAIVKHGLADASIQRIAEEAGVPAGLVHHYFASKEALLIATVDQVVAEQRDPLLAEIAILDPERALARALDYLFLEVPADRPQNVLFAEIGVAALRRPQLRRRIAALNAEIIRELAALLGRLPDLDGRDADNADLALLLMTLFTGADGLAQFDSRIVNPRRLRLMADELVARFRGAHDEQADVRAAAHDRRLRGDRARRRGAHRRAPVAR